MFRATEDAAQRTHQALRRLGLIAAVVVSLAAGPAGAGGLCPADLNGSGMVGTDDLLILLANWGECPPPDCCTAHGGLGCPGDPRCEECVCTQDGFCCNVAWDAICAGRATGVCSASCTCAVGVPDCPGDINGDGVIDVDDLLILLDDWGECPEPVCGGTGDCCEPHGGLGCADEACCECVCDGDPFCCEILWDDICVATATTKCTLACRCVNDCCVANLTPGCEDARCEACVCASNPLCCTLQPPFGWGSDCAAVAASGCIDACPCGPLCGPGAGTCCVGTTSAGCESPECCDCVCAQDAFCCQVVWDSICASRAATVCEDACPCAGDG